ncbi:hypothetical protein ACLI4Z_03855 [Natrialbaceae archaeon A-arb3/5]
MTVSNDVSRDELFDILSSHRRRYTLHACKRSDRPVELSELAEQVAAWEYGKDRAAVTSDERHRIYTSLQQRHLPTMASAGIVTCDGRTVDLTDHAAEVEIYLDVVPERSIPWAQYYFGLSVLAAALVAGVWIGLYPSSIPELAWAALIVAVLIPSSAYHVWRSRRSRLGLGTPPEVDPS